MLRLKNLANKYQKRLVRPLYANTQATPYAAALADTFRAADGSLQLPKTIGNGGVTSLIGTRTADAYPHKNGLPAGLVMVRVPGTSKVDVASGVVGASLAQAEKPFGLLANFVGGDLDEGFSGDSLQNQVGVWRGPDAIFEILAPAFDDTGLATASTTGAGAEILLYAAPDGRLVYLASPGNRLPVARLVERVDSSRIIVDLIV